MNSTRVIPVLIIIRFTRSRNQMENTSRLEVVKRFNNFINAAMKLLAQEIPSESIFKLYSITKRLWEISPSNPDIPRLSTDAHFNLYVEALSVNGINAVAAIKIFCGLEIPSIKTLLPICGPSHDHEVKFLRKELDRSNDLIDEVTKLSIELRHLHEEEVINLKADMAKQMSKHTNEVVGLTDEINRLKSKLSTIREVIDLPNY